MPYSKICKFLSILIIAGIYSCKKHAAQRLLFLDDIDGGISWEILSGNIKQVITKGIGQKKDFYQNILFDEQGDLTFTERQYMDIAITEHSTDSTMVIEKIKFKTTRGDDSSITITGDYIDTNAYQERWRFDWNNHLIDSHSTKYKHNANGDLVELRRSYNYMSKTDLFKYKYDNNHKLIESTLYEPTRYRGDLLLVKTIFEYKTFDNYNNWIKRIKRTKFFGPLVGLNNADDTVTRKITYY